MTVGLLETCPTVYPSPSLIWFNDLIHLERGYSGNKPMFESEELSTTFLYLDQGKLHKAAKDHKLLPAFKAAQLCTKISSEILFIQCVCTAIYKCTVYVCDLCMHTCSRDKCRPQAWLT